MYLGVAWYPEHWDESRWPDDLKLMQKLHMNVVRVAEFAWSRMEPEEGQFDLDWLERAVDLAAEYGLATVLGTPSAAPPAWLTHKYPETLAVRQDGQRARHGARCHYSPASQTYRAFTRRIAEKMAVRFGNNPNVIGWQIDNEYNSFSYDSETLEQWRKWLKERYVSLELLNNRWSTVFWSQEYTDWDQIPLPIGFHNPGLNLDWKRFITYTYKSFQKEQVDAIRKHADPRQWITHNFMGYYDLFDHYELNEDLDLASWDCYVSHGHLDYHFNGSAHDLTRGFQNKNFWIMETQCGWTCGSMGGTQNALNRGEIRTLTWHHVGHGADAVLYWQWRSALGGQEQYGGTIVAPDGDYRRQHTEFEQIGCEFRKAEEALRGTSPVSQTAILHSYEDRWTINNFRHSLNFCPVNHFVNYYRAIRDITHEIDIIHPLKELGEYRLVVAPSLHILNEERTANLRNYVLSGGHLVLGARSGVKDDYDSFLQRRQPGDLADLLGAHVDEFYGLDAGVPVTGTLGSGESLNWAEILQVDSDDTEVMLRYGKCNGWLDGQPAVVTRKIGNGRMTYLGAWLDKDLMKSMARWLVEVSGIKTPFGPVPEGVEVCRRIGEGKEVFIVINHSRTDQVVCLPRPMTDILTDQKIVQTLPLPALGVAVLL